MTNARLNIEKSVLGGLLLFPKVWDDLQLVADYFDDALNRIIFNRVCELRDSGAVPSVTLVNGGLKSEAIVRVFECADFAPYSADSVVYHVQELKAIWAKRKLEIAGATLLESASDPSSDVADLTSYALAEVDKISASQAQLQISYPGDYLDDYVAEMASRPPFMATCWKRLNKMIGGFRNGGFYVIAGRPGQGKTIVALQSAFALAKSGRHVLYFSLEMPALQLQHRLLAQVLEIDYSKIANDELDFEITDTSGGQLREVWARDLVKSSAGLLGNNLGIISSGRLTPNMVRAYISAASKVRPVDAVFIDYLGLMSDDVAHKDKTERVGAISGALKQMALELDIPFITAVQLNREAENRANDKPQLSDLRDSGSIEQDADVVLMIKRKHRPEENKDVGNGLDFFLVVAKNRHGQTGAAKFTAQDNLSRIVEQ
jgi:replicative DNA helicase